VEGPAVRELSKLTVATWQGHGRVVLDPRVFLPETTPVGEQRVNIIGSRERKKRKTIRKSYLYAIRRAREYIYIANAYFLPDAGFRRALRNAVSRGVDVRVMVPARGDILPVQLASQTLFAHMLRRKIRIFLREDAVLHAKTAVIDSQWATVGSFNIDHRSWAMNLEVNVNVIGPEFAGELKQVFLDGQASCRELILAKWKQRSFLVRILEEFCYLFRRWM
jgi:cardiolipin synthase